jgi:type III secretory pathway component EscS
MQPAHITPKDFFLWAGVVLSFYGSVGAFVALVFDYLNHLFPDPLSYYTGDPYSSGIANEMAIVIVLFPLFLFLMRTIRKTIQADSTRAEVWVRRWALFLTLFLAAAAIVGTVIALLVYFFQGDVTIRFVLKVLTLLLVAGVTFSAFLADLRGYWGANPARAAQSRWGALAFVLAVIVAGFFIVGTPWQARLYRFDDQKVSDLQMLQGQILNHWQSKEKLPVQLDELNDSISGFIIPRDPQSGVAYEYAVTGPLSFQLCASFNALTQNYASASTRAQYVPKPAAIDGPMPVQDNWYHEAGRQCFTRTIDPELYPPYSKLRGQ